LFVAGAAEPFGRVHIPKAAHWVITLFDAAMILLDPVVQLGIAAVDDLLA